MYVGILLGHGGDALQMLGLADGIKAAGARVRIVVPEVATSVTFKERCDALGIDCERSPWIAVSSSGSRVSLRAMPGLLSRLNARIVHFHTGNSCLPRSVMLALEFARHPAVLATLQSPYETIVPGSLRARFWAACARRRLRAVVSPSDHATRFQRRCGVPAEIAVTVRNGVETKAMSGGDGRGPRSELGLGSEGEIVLFCSRIAGQKRPLDAVRIFAAVASEFPKALLAFVGEGDEEPAARAEAARLGVGHRVRFLGYRTNIADWLAAATIWLLPTERENFSAALLEALAAGCPIVTTRCPGNDEILADGRNALTFAVGDIRAGAECLLRLLRDKGLRDRLRSGAQAVAQEYSVARMVEVYRGLYRVIRPGAW